MERTMMQKLLEWKNSMSRKPLLLRGARQVGKTWLLKEFGKRHYKKCAYVRFDKAKNLQEIFDREYDIGRLLTAIQLEVGFKPTPEDTLIIFDEIQQSASALTSLKYFCEDAPEYAIAAAGSQLGISDKQGTGFPVGKVNTLYLHPMSFLEFLEAIGQKGHADLLRQGDWIMSSSYHELYTDWLRHYFFIGGMPEVVDNYSRNGDFRQVRILQNNLLQNYQDDFGKHAPPEDVRRIELIWDSLPSQLSKENKKFMASNLQEHIKKDDLLTAMQWLLGAALIRHTKKVSKPDLPLSGYTDGGFKVFMLDVGLLTAKSNLDAKVILDGSRIFEEFKGALAEQFVQQELTAYFDAMTYYWSSEKSHNEIDFLIDITSTMVPIETKASYNLKAKSLKAFCGKFRPPIAIRTSLAKYYRQTIPFPTIEDTDTPASYDLVDIPLYALCQLEQELQKT